MQSLSENQRRALHAVLKEVLVYARSWTNSVDVLSPERCSQLNKLFNLTHNVPSFIEGEHPFGFDEQWFTQALTDFDRANGTSFARTYSDELQQAPVLEVLSLKDPSWREMRGAYRVQYDLRPVLNRLETSEDVTLAWGEVWEEVCRKGIIGDGSFAAVPHLVRIHCARNFTDRNTYAIVTMIELVRGRFENPDVPEWLADMYFNALEYLVEIGLDQLTRDGSNAPVQAILALVAVVNERPVCARLLLDYTEEQLEQRVPWDPVPDPYEYVDWDE